MCFCQSSTQQLRIIIKVHNDEPIRLHTQQKYGISTLNAFQKLSYITISYIATVFGLYHKTFFLWGKKRTRMLNIRAYLD